jgi:alpha-tubulin suppressor-like RCC1 family protein
MFSAFKPRLTITILILMGFACSPKEDHSTVAGFAEIASANLGPDGNFNVTCTDGSTEVVAAAALSLACEPKISNPPVDLASNGSDFCARYADNSVKCWSTLDRRESPVYERPPFFGNKAKGIDLNAGHACAVTDEGAVTCWGNNFAGVLDVPQALTRPNSVKQVAVGFSSACAVRTDDTVQCWNRSPDFPLVPAPADLGPVAGIVDANNSYCAIRRNGTVRCWGTDTSVSFVPNDLQGVKTLSEGFGSSCAIVGSGSLRCWNNVSGYQSAVTAQAPTSLQDVTSVSLYSEVACATRSNSAPVCWGDNSRNQLTLPPDLKPSRKIALGFDTACAIQNDGELVCWKNGGIKIPTSETHTAQFLVAKKNSVCSIDGSGASACWGRNLFLPRADNSSNAVFNIDTFVSASEESINGQAIALGGAHSCFLQQGFLQCSGNNSAGQGTRFQPVDDGDNLGLIAGSNHNCSIRADKTVKCWGENNLGQLNVPRDLLNVQTAVAGGDHTCALTSAGTVRCWGANQFGQSTVPATLPRVQALALGDNHSCALTAAGAVSCWGDDSQKQATPPALTQLAKAVTAGSQHTCAILQDNSLRCWGSNRKGETLVPKGLGPVSTVAAGEAFTCAVKSVGSTVECWGDNTFGQLEVPNRNNATFATRSNKLGDRVFLYDGEVMLGDSASGSYRPVYQDVVAYQGLKGTDGKDLAYDITLSYQRSCEPIGGSDLVFSLVGTNLPTASTILPIRRDSRTLSFRNLSGAARIQPGVIFSPTPVNSSFSFVQVAAGTACSLTVQRITIQPAANITAVLSTQATTLASTIDRNLSNWLRIRTLDDVRRDGVRASKANLEAKRAKLVETVLNILFVRQITPAKYGLNQLDWTPADIENGLFSDLSEAFLLQDETGRKDWENVRMAKPQAQWPAWASDLFNVFLDDLGRSGGELVAESLLDYQSLLENLKGEVAPNASLAILEETLKESVRQARSFLVNTNEVRETIAGEILILQQSAVKGSDVCQRSPAGATTAQCL